MRQASNHLRYVIQIFGLLDIILALRFFGQIKVPTWIDDMPLWSNVIEIFKPIFVLSCIIGGVGLILYMHWAKILSLIQFPFRFIYMLFTFGFLTLIAKPVQSLELYNLLIVIAIIAEVVRLGVTWKSICGITKISN